MKANGDILGTDFSTTTLTLESELPGPIPRNSVESDHGSSRIYFDNDADVI